MKGVLKTDGLEWIDKKCVNLPANSLLGIDKLGQKWIIKRLELQRVIRGCIFSELLNKLDIPVQDARYCILDEKSRQAYEPNYALAIKYMDNEHVRKPCGNDCPFACVGSFSYGSQEHIEFLCRFYKGQEVIFGLLLSWLVNSFEPPDLFYTKNHQVVMIDTDLCFSADWRLLNHQFAIKTWLDVQKGKGLFRELAQRFLALSENDIYEIVCIPPGFRPYKNKKVANFLLRTQKLVSDLLANGK